MKIEYLNCQCYSPEHTLRFMLDEEGELYTEVYLNQYHNIFKRLWIALKYVFGYKCRYGHWDVFMLKSEDKSKLLDLIKQSK